MTAPESSTAAARLCAACGLCCNGVLFHTVRLQAGDSAKELAALGLKLKRKQGRHFILQPCPAFREMRCAIYAARPERCRLFECRQLRRVAAGEIAESAARENIGEARRRVAEINELLPQAGGTNLKRPLAKRCEKALADLPEAAADPAAMRLRGRLVRAIEELDALLDREFRVVPRAVAEADSLLYSAPEGDGCGTPQAQAGPVGTAGS